MTASLLAGIAVLIFAAGRPASIGGRRPVPGVVRFRRAPGGADLVRATVARFRTDSRIDPAAIARWVDDLARHLRHGATLHDALTTVVPEGSALAAASRPLRHALARGATVGAACDAWQQRLDADDMPRRELLRTLASVVAVSARLGGPTADPLDRVGVVMRQHASEDLERSAQSAQARISARVLTLLPIATLTLIATTDPEARSVITEPSGAVVVAVGMALNLAGAVWMRRITRVLA